MLNRFWEEDMKLKTLLLGACSAVVLCGFASAETLTIATVNNGDMIRMQKLTDDFTSKNPDIQLDWVTLEENVLRQRVTTDIATKGGQYDVLTIGTYEVPIWAKQGWLLPLDNLGADYDVDDLLPAIRSGLTGEDGKLYAAPFYGESSMVMYRKDLFEKAGLTMPEAPTWEFIADAARKITDKDKEIYGICLRGKAGWGENMAFLTATANAFGARWFDENWKPQFDQPEWKNALDFYVKLMNDAGPPGASSNGFNENLALFQTGKCGMWIDATVAASFVTEPEGHRRSPTRSASRSRPTPGSASAATGCGPGIPGHPGWHAEAGGGREVCRLGDRQGLPEAGGREGRLGERASGHPHLALREPGIPEGGAVCEDDARHRSTRPIRRIRPSSRCPMSACSSWRSPNSRVSARRSASSSRQRLRGR